MSTEHEIERELANCQLPPTTPALRQTVLQAAETAWATAPDNALRDRVLGAAEEAWQSPEPALWKTVIRWQVAASLAAACLVLVANAVSDASLSKWQTSEPRPQTTQRAPIPGMPTPSITLQRAPDPAAFRRHLQQTQDLLADALDSSS